MAKGLKRQLDARFAQTLVDIVAAELNKNVNITDEHGVIIASFSTERITQVHEIAANMLQTGVIRECAVSEEDERQWKGVRKGWNVPILFENHCVGVIGVSGEPDTSAPYARLAARFVEAALQANARQEELVQALNEKKELQSSLMNRIIQAQEEERRRISRELHDETSQALTSIIVGLRVLAAGAKGQEEESSLLQMRDLAVLTLEAVHHLAVELRPILLDDLGLLAAVQKYIEGYMKQYGILVHLHVSNMHRERFPSELETTIYRILQEALTNAARHAQAEQIDVTLAKQRGKIILVVADNGVGFAEGRYQGHQGYTALGIYGMRERTALLDGTLEIKSSPGDGTTLIVEIPLRKRKKTEEL